jgi:hypothetical protein
MNSRRLDFGQNRYRYDEKLKTTTVLEIYPTEIFQKYGHPPSLYSWLIACCYCYGSSSRSSVHGIAIQEIFNKNNSNESTVDWSEYREAPWLIMEGIAPSF